jgi:RimJ/RimL family protein N-acetyltransferase
MHTELVPNQFQVPEKLETEEFIIRKLCFSDADLDYKAVMSSIDIIKKTRGGSWPSSELSFVEDQIDLGWHQREFENKTSFAYTVTSVDGKECLGCLYLYPPGYRDEISKHADVDVSFWVTQTAYNKGLYATLYKKLDNWLKSTWPFKTIVYTNTEIPS